MHLSAAEQGKARYLPPLMMMMLMTDLACPLDAVEDVENRTY